MSCWLISIDIFVTAQLQSSSREILTRWDYIQVCLFDKVCLQVMDYSHWDYNTDDEDGGDDNIYTDDEEADEAASDDNRD